MEIYIAVVVIMLVVLLIIWLAVKQDEVLRRRDPMDNLPKIDPAMIPPMPPVKPARKEEPVFRVPNTPKQSSPRPATPPPRATSASRHTAAQYSSRSDDTTDNTAIYAVMAASAIDSTPSRSYDTCTPSRDYSSYDSPSSSDSSSSPSSGCD